MLSHVSCIGHTSCYCFVSCGFCGFIKVVQVTKGLFTLNVGLWLIHLTIFLLFYVIVYNYIHDDDCDLDIQLVS